MSDVKNMSFLLPNKVSASDGVSVKRSQAEGDAFSDMLKDAIKSVNSAQLEADDAVQKVMSGETKDIHDTMIALQKADVSLKLMLEVRNKITEAYQELIRTQV